MPTLTDTLPAAPVQNAQSPLVQRPPSDFLDYAKAKQRFDNRIQVWNKEIENTKRRRKERYIDLDVEQLRQSGAIGEDETFIPTRIIDVNITREKADAMNFLNSSNRLAYFRCVDDPNVDARQLDSDVTKGLTYPGWYQNFQRHWDGSALHGWNSIEVMYDESKPLHVGFEEIGHENLLFNTKIKNIQDDEFILRRYEVTVMKLLDFVTDYAFDQSVVFNLTSNLEHQRQDNIMLTIYKCYYKIDGIVYVGWYSGEPKAQTWLKAPQKLVCGIRKLQVQPQQTQTLNIGAGIEQASLAADNLANSNIDENTAIPSGTTTVQAPISIWMDEDVKEYPIYLFIYRDDEQQALADHKGRGFFDLPQQEAVTAVTTGFINGILKASQIYASPQNDVDDTTTLKQLELPITGGKIFNKRVDFWGPPYPDPMVLNSLQYLSQANAQETGKMAVAVSNRKDSRKTAKELDLASGEQQKITTVGLADYSEFLRSLYTFSWKIIQSQALEGKIVLLPSQGQPDPLTGQVQKKNNTEIIKLNFDIRAAGDIDVVQKEQELQKRREDWPVIQNTPLAGVFLSDYIRLQYPTYAEKYIQVLQQGDMAKNIIQSLLTVLQGALQPNEIKGNEAQLQQIVGAAQQFLQQPNFNQQQAA